MELESRKRFVEKCCRQEIGTVSVYIYINKDPLSFRKENSIILAIRCDAIETLQHGSGGAKYTGIRMSKSIALGVPEKCM
jgi:hypothetical protein